MRRRRFVSYRAVLFSAMLPAVSCGRSEANVASAATVAAGWVQVHEQADPENPGSIVRVAIDTTGARQLADGSYLLWIETRHSVPRLEGGRPFDRELLRFALRCGPGAPPTVEFRRVSATLLLGEQPPIYQEAIALDKLDQLAWDRLKPGATADSSGFTRACALARR